MFLSALRQADLPKDRRARGEIHDKPRQPAGAKDFVEPVFFAEGRADGVAFAGPTLRFRIAAGQQKKLAIGPFFGRKHQHRVRFVDASEKKEIRTLPKPVAIFVPFGEDDRNAFADLFHKRVPPRSIY